MCHSYKALNESKENKVTDEPKDKEWHASVTCKSTIEKELL